MATGGFLMNNSLKLSQSQINTRRNKSKTPFDESEWETVSYKKQSTKQKGKASRDLVCVKCNDVLKNRKDLTNHIKECQKLSNKDSFMKYQTKKTTQVGDTNDKILPASQPLQTIETQEVYKLTEAGGEPMSYANKVKSPPRVAAKSTVPQNAKTSVIAEHIQPNQMHPVVNMKDDKNHPGAAKNNINKRKKGQQTSSTTQLAAMVEPLATADEVEVSAAYEEIVT